MFALNIIFLNHLLLSTSFQCGAHNFYFTTLNKFQKNNCCCCPKKNQTKKVLPLQQKRMYIILKSTTYLIPFSKKTTFCQNRKPMRIYEITWYKFQEK